MAVILYTQNIMFIFSILVLLHLVLFPFDRNILSKVKVPTDLPSSRGGLGVSSVPQESSASGGLQLFVVSRQV